MELIHAYSRQQAIMDGFLVDVSETAKEAGFKYPVALTHAAYEACVAWTSTDSEKKGVPQDESGRLWDVVYMAMLNARRSQASEFTYEVFCVPREGNTTSPQSTKLKAECGPGDTLDPVITIMLPNED